MKILVTGAKGQVGSELILRGNSSGHQMIAASHAELDITQQQAVSDYVVRHTPDLVINGAAYTAVDKAEEEHLLAHAINADGAAYLAQACVNQKIPLLHISTDYVFDGNKETAYLEDDPPNPQGVYGASKLAGEQAVVKVLNQHLILRVAWVFGEFGNNFVRTMLRLGKEHPELRVVADQFGGPTWAGDIADVLLSISERYGRGDVIPWGTYHYIGEPRVSWCEFAREIFSQAVFLEILERAPKVMPITSAEYPTPAKRPGNSVLDCTKLKQNLEICQPDWRIGLKHTLKKWKKL